MRGGDASGEGLLAETALDGELPHGVELERSADTEMAGRVRLRFVESGADYQVVSEEAVLADEASHGVAGSEVALSFLKGEGKAIAERWLSEARLAQDRIRFSLPLSCLALGAGDVVGIESDAGPKCYRIERVELGEQLTYEAVAVDASLYERPALEPTEARMPVVAAPEPVTPLFMDLPFIKGDEVPHAPYVVAVAEPWPGSIRVYDSASDEGYRLNVNQSARARLGVLESDLSAGRLGVMDRGAPLTMRMISGDLASVTEDALLAGGNVVLIGDGSAGNWEIVQFQTATLVGE